MSVLEAVAALVKLVADLIRQGVSDEDILARLSDPTGVGQHLIDAARGRRKRLDDYVEHG